MYLYKKEVEVVRFRILILILIVSMVFVVGCTQDDDIVSGAFVGGTNGLSIGFGKDAPPARVFDFDSGENGGEDFDILVEVENKGEYDIPGNEIIVTLSGIDVRDFGLNSPHRILDRTLEGQGEFNGKVVNGDKDELIYEGAEYNFDLSADWKTTIRADICYEYQTKATTSICLKRKATDREIDDVCQMNDENVQVENSGAPVQIEQVSTRSSASSEIMISFVVRNKGEGLIHPPGTFTNKCIKEEDEEDRLKLEVFSGSGRYAPECSQLGNKNIGEVKLTNNEKVVRCRIKTINAPESAVEEPINIRATYMYRNAISTDLIVEDSEEN